MQAHLHDPGKFDASVYQHCANQERQIFQLRFPSEFKNELRYSSRGLCPCCLEYIAIDLPRLTKVTDLINLSFYQNSKFGMDKECSSVKGRNLLLQIEVYQSISMISSQNLWHNLQTPSSCDFSMKRNIAFPIQSNQGRCQTSFCAIKADKGFIDYYVFRGHFTIHLQLCSSKNMQCLWEAHGGQLSINKRRGIQGFFESTLAPISHLSHLVSVLYFKALACVGFSEVEVPFCSHKQISTSSKPHQ